MDTIKLLKNSVYLIRIIYYCTRNIQDRPLCFITSIIYSNGTCVITYDVLSTQILKWGRDLNIIVCFTFTSGMISIIHYN